MVKKNIKTAEVRLSYSTKVKASERSQVKISNGAFRLFLNTWDMDTIELVENCKLMLLNRADKVLGIATISQGGLSGTVTDVRVTMQYSIKSHASSIILCHNHQSGNLQPSDSDLRITENIKSAAETHEIKLLEHLIISEEGYYSKADNGFV